MDKEQFQRDIQKADNDSLRIGAANRIVQLLDKQRYSNNENSVKRWIWELCQNAKDVSNDTGKVKISIDFNKTNNTVIFRHNGRPFTMANIMSLINQSSSKDRYNGSERKSGKFGTGFITTHLLSEIVNVSGIIEDEKATFSKFQITLDRTGHDKNEIVSAMEKAVDQLQACQPLTEGEITSDEYNTVFEYKLDNGGVEVAQQGIDNLRVSAPFVLSMLRDIEEIALEATTEKYKYSKPVSCGLDGSLIHEIIYESDAETKKIYVLNLMEENTTVSIALEHREHGAYILPFAGQQSKLFCDFPLIGTEDFPFPVLICASDFNPTEPRDGIYLTCKSKADDKVEQNRSIIETACRLYKKLLQYAAEKKWEGIYNITRIGSYGKREWIDEEWIENIVENCKNIILHVPIIHTSVDSMMELQDYFDEEQIYVISDSKADMREKIWDLLYYIMPEKIPCKEDIHNWYHSLWNDCNRYTFKSLTKQINDFGNAMQLQREIKDKDWCSWLSQYFNLIEDNRSLQTYVATEQINIIPNQNAVFCHVEELYFDKGILDQYKDILKLLGNDCRGWLLNLEFRNRDWFRFGEYDDEQILKLIENSLDDADKQQKSDILFQMVWLCDNKCDNVGVQRQICNYANSILKIDNQMVEVQMVSDRIWQESMKYTITYVADRISEYGCIQAFAQYMEISQDAADRLLAEFIEFIVKTGYDNLINKSTKPILPNQNGAFMIKDDIFLDNQIDETLKELAVSAGYDIKADLLIKDIYLDLPESRWKSDIDLSLPIIQYVNNNRSSKEEEVRNNFKKLLIWMSNHEEKAKEIFPDLYRNKHYLYDDEQIIDDIKHADTLKHLMQKFNVTSPERLEELIAEGQMHYVEKCDEKIELTQDVLLQLGIDSEEELDTAFKNADFASKYVRPSKHDPDTFEYVKTILERSKKNILSYLDGREEYDISGIQQVSNTIFIIKKSGKQIYLLARPSDGEEFRIFYKTEKDVLDYSMDWELWVEDGRSEPQKITFGKIVKLTGLNRIPLRGM